MPCDVVDFRYGKGQSGGPAILKIVVDKGQFLSYAEKNGINFEAPVGRLPGRTETVLPAGPAEDFNDMALFMTHEDD